jgi:methionyl-tRNA synthetase
VLFDLAESLRAAAILVKPFLPHSAETIYKSFNFIQSWDKVRYEDVWVYPRQNDDLRVLAQLDAAGKVKALFPRIA